VDVKGEKRRYATDCRIYDAKMGIENVAAQFGATHLLVGGTEGVGELGERVGEAKLLDEADGKQGK
jgi:hypothetical protein